MVYVAFVEGLYAGCSRKLHTTRRFTGVSQRLEVGVRIPQFTRTLESEITEISHSNPDIITHLKPLTVTIP